MKDLLRDAFAYALSAVAPAKVVPPALPAPPPGRTIVVGAGKAAAAMARAVEDNWPADRPLAGLVVTQYGYSVPCRRIKVIEAGHPLPDEAGTAAAAEMLASVNGLTPDDLVLALFSGGGSSLLPLPAPGLTLEDKRAVTSHLLRAGATIAEINCVRKHLSAVKGGRLALACLPARVVNLLISDVAGDDPALIASGPGLPDPSTREEAAAVLDKYRGIVPRAVKEHLAVTASETPKPGDPRFSRVSASILCASKTILAAAEEFFLCRGITPTLLGDAVEGESRQVAAEQAAMMRAIWQHGRPVAAPCVLLSGGETTVTIRGRGRGGPNLEFLLALMLALAEEVPFAALACDTDGRDGASGVAGAVADHRSLPRALASGLDPAALLADNDSLAFFSGLQDLVDPGPTFTNVNDFRAIVLSPVPDCDLL